MTNKEIKQKRMLTYFVEATQKIIESEGVQAVTVRKVADIAGFNSSTLYNYFIDRDDLILFASIKKLIDYNTIVSKSIKECKTERERYYKMWNTFCEISFNSPKDFSHIFFNKHYDNLTNLTKKYYEVFLVDKIHYPEEVETILTNPDFFERSRIPLENIAKEENIKWKDLDLLNDIIISLYKNLLFIRSINPKSTSAEEYCSLMDKYLDYLLKNGVDES